MCFRAIYTVWWSVSSYRLCWVCGKEDEDNHSRALEPRRRTIPPKTNPGARWTNICSPIDLGNGRRARTPWRGEVAAGIKGRSLGLTTSGHFPPLTCFKEASG